MTHISPLLRAAEQSATTQGAVAREPAGPHAFSSPLRAGWRRLVSTVRAFEASPFSNWIGGAVLFGMLIVGLWIGTGLGMMELPK
ncbi:hypothetical protein [Acidimangrovimonas sediminis]|uniref:hypothetical protein n=1 Tax=Acidimangrovimonas sediminis TaxID=2056283 RepID=UPI000C80BB32|nr:hypothetical protein [Acidimangrovimonas sediminis]